MNNQEVLLDALLYYDIPVLNIQENSIEVIKNYRIEVEANGMYKLLDGELVIAPFDDLDELCRFILM